MKKTILFSLFLFAFASALPAAEETLQSKQIANCDRIGYPEWRDDCYESLGSSVLDYAVCVKFTNKERRDTCISNHPPRSADDCLLNRSDKKVQNACLELFGQSPKTHLNKVASKPASQPPARKINQAELKQNPDKAAKLQRAREEKQAHALEKAIKLQAAKDASTAKAQERTAKIEATKNEQAQVKAAKIQKAKDEKEARAQAASAKIEAAKAKREAKAQERAAKLQAEKDARAAQAQQVAAKNQAAKDAKAQEKAERIQKEKEAREAKAQNKINKAQEKLSTPVSVDSVEEKTEALVPSVIIPKPTVEGTPIEAPQPIVEQNSTESATDQKGDETAQEVPAEKPPIKITVQEKTEKLQKAKAEREAQAKEKADKLKAAKEAAAKEKAEKLQKIKDDKEAAAREKAEKLQKAKEERGAARKPQTKVTSDDKSPLKPGETFNTNTTGLELKLVGFGCTKGFGSWTEPPQNKKDEISCDKENVKQFSTLLNRCLAADHDINILSFDMNKDGCVTCADLKIWQKQVNKLFGEKKRSTDGRNLKLKECLERKF